MNISDKLDGSRKKEINLWEYWTIIWRRKWTIITFVLVLFAFATIRSYTIKPIYTAHGTLLIEKEPNILTFEQIFQIETFSDDYYQTQHKLLRSRSLADKAIERLGLYEGEKPVGRSSEGNDSKDKSDTVFRRRLMDSFLGRLEVNPIRQTRLVEVRFKDHDPKFAAGAVNAIFDSFIDMNIEAKYEATAEATEFLTDQIASLSDEIEEKERELQEYGAERNIIALSEKETTIVDKLGELNRALTEAQIDKVRRRAYYNEIKIASPDFIPDALTNPLIQKLREEYVRLKREYMKKQEIFRPDYPEMQRLKAELESAAKSLESETQNLIKGAYSDYRAALNKEKSLEYVFNKQKQEAIQLNSNSILYNSLKIEAENKKSLLELLLRRQSETGVSARLRGLKTSNARVVDRAEVPLSPSSPNKKLNMILAIMTGLAGGLGLAFLFEHLDNSVKSPDDVEKYTGLPTLGVVQTFSLNEHMKGHGYGKGTKRKTKNVKRKDISIKLGTSKSDENAEVRGENEKTEMREFQKERSIELISHFSPHSNLSESYRSLRTALLLSSADPNLKSLAISSPLPLEGKTVTVSNLAVTLAHSDKRVVIVDADLRKPRQHRIFNLQNFNGLTNFLTADVEMEGLFKRTQIPNLFLINSGPIPPNAAELLGSKKMTSLTEVLKQQFDYVLFDTPPVLAVSDAMVLDSNIDGMILVVWGEKTSKEALKQAKEKLDLLNIRTLGVVINNINIRKHGYYYSHYYYQYGGEEERLKTIEEAFPNP